LVVDEHPLTRKGLCDAIVAQDDLMVCGESESWREALDMIRRDCPDVVVLDLNLKDGNGWELLRQVRSEELNARILVVSVCDEQVYAARLLKAGARGYLMKDAPVTQVLGAIRKVRGGDIAVSEAVASLLIHNATQKYGKAETTSDSVALSNRELQVLDYLRQGMGNREIAECLRISQKTIGTYKARLMEKIGVRTAPELLEHLQSDRNNRAGTLTDAPAS
jgi:DNA-binding NarL/FixJ family response regulator